MLKQIQQQVLITARRHVSASVVGDNKFILLQDDDGKSMKFPGIWLRDNCQCSECYHPPTGSRLINWNTFNPKVKVKCVQIGSDDAHPRSVKVEWNDEHRCEFDWRWLMERDFSLQNRQKSLQETHPPPDLWSAKEFSSKLKRFDFDEVLRSDCALYEWIQTLAVQGVAVISNAGDISGRVTELANRIGFIKRTTYGLFQLLEEPCGFSYNSGQMFKLAPLPPPSPTGTNRIFFNISNRLKVVAMSCPPARLVNVDCFTTLSGVESHYGAMEVLR